MPANNSPLWSWLYYVTTLTAMGLWMSFGYEHGFSVSADGPALLMFAGGIGGLDLFNRWKHKKAIASLKSETEVLDSSKGGGP